MERNSLRGKASRMRRALHNAPAVIHTGVVVASWKPHNEPSQPLQPLSYSAPPCIILYYLMNYLLGPLDNPAGVVWIQPHVKLENTHLSGALTRPANFTSHLHKYDPHIPTITNFYNPEKYNTKKRSNENSIRYSKAHSNKESSPTLDFFLTY